MEILHLTYLFVLCDGSLLKNVHYYVFCIFLYIKRRLTSIEKLCEVQFTRTILPARKSDSYMYMHSFRSDFIISYCIISVNFTSEIQLINIFTFAVGLLSNFAEVA